LDRATPALGRRGLREHDHGRGPGHDQSGLSRQLFATRPDQSQIRPDEFLPREPEHQARDVNQLPRALDFQPMVPSVQFCLSAHGRRLAYSRLGEGPLLVLPPGWISHLGVLWENARFRRFVGALAQHNTVVWFDRQGCGYSGRDRVDFSIDADVLDLETLIA